MKYSELCKEISKVVRSKPLSRLEPHLHSTLCVCVCVCVCGSSRSRTSTMLTTSVVTEMYGWSISWSIKVVKMGGLEINVLTLRRPYRPHHCPQICPPS
jgi:hypothetical protein